jgi:hypothetical protein
MIGAVLLFILDYFRACILSADIEVRLSGMPMG